MPTEKKEILVSPAPDATAADHIGRQLQALYDEVVEQPLPDTLLSLLGKLETATKNKT